MEVRDPDLSPLPEPIRRELVARHMARDRADTRLSDYILGLCHGRGIPLERWVGFDDQTGDIMLAPEEVKVD